MRTFVKFVGIAALIVIAAIILLGRLLKSSGTASMVPADYTEKVETGGDIEAKYLAFGGYEIARVTGNFPKGSPETWGSYTIYYPQELENGADKYPVVVSVNGTGVSASRYEALLEHLASWGFIVLGNEDPDTHTGSSADATLSILLTLNEDPSSVFYQKADVDHIGIFGHSQGGVAVFNAISGQSHSTMYRCAVALSPSDEENSAKQGRPYDASKAAIPIMVLAGTELDAISLENMQAMYESIRAPRLFARKTGMGHSQMLYSADGYVTAWFMWHLQNDEIAAAAFTDHIGEIRNNPLYQDVRSALE